MLYRFKGHHGRDSVCDIERNGNVIIATELAENTGTSITNAAEILAEELCTKFKIPKDELTWIEHYNKGSYKEGFDTDDYSVVEFFKTEPKLTLPLWTPITKERALEIFNQ